MLIAPTEPTILREIGRVSSLPETMGVDVLISCSGGFAGIQRKEYADLLASLHDGRLTKELQQMKRLPVALLIVEGRLQWTTDGVLIQRRRHAKPWTKTHHRNLLLSVQRKGVWVQLTESLNETITACKEFARWINKPEHRSLDRRPGPQDQSVWGRAGTREFQHHIVQGFPGIGPEMAERIVTHFHGLPLQWTVTEKELLAVPGLGKKKAERLLGALGRGDE